MRALPALVAIFVLSTWPAVAAAIPGDDLPLPGDSTADAQDDVERTHRGHWWGDLGLYTGDAAADDAAPDASMTLLTLDAGVFYRVRRTPIAFEAQVGLLAFFLSAEGEDTRTTGLFMNPGLAAYFAPRLRRVDLRIGVGLGFPLAGVRRDDDFGTDAALDALAYQVAAASNGLWDWWKWAPDRLTLLLPTASLEARLGEHFVVGGEVGVHLLFSTASDETPGGVSVDTATDTIFQLGGEIAYQSRSTRTGLHFRMVTLLTGDDEEDPDEDRTQLSLEPYLRFQLGRGFFRIALTMNLDEPFGFSFAGGPTKIWGLHLGGGTVF
jgi:hypothetical protein